MSIVRQAGLVGADGPLGVTLTATRDAAPVAGPRAAADLDFAEFARREERRLRQYVHRRLGNWHEAEEITQETLLRAYLNRDSLPDDRSAAAWCSTVARNLVIDRLRVAPRSTTLADIPERSRVQRDVADVAAARADARLALSVLGELPDRQAAVLWAREVEGLSYDAIGERMSLSEPAVRSALFRARRALRERYLRRGGTLPVTALSVLAVVRRLGRRPSGRQASLATAAAVAVGTALVLVPNGGGAPPDGPHPTGAGTRPVAHQAAPASQGLRTRPARATGPTAGVITATRPTARWCAGGLRTHACVSHMRQMPGTSLVVYLPAPVPITHTDGAAVSTTGVPVVGSCSAVPSTRVVGCEPATTSSKRR